MAPHILKDSPPKPDDLHLDPSALDAIFEGLRSGVEDESGTSNHIDYPTGRERIITVPGVTVLGKTGTATASPIVGKGPDGTVSVLRSGDHAWMLALVGKEGQAPRYAIAVIMEFAGSGGRVAGPIADQVIWALRAEGYL
jgi:cell division protein FtsI/penicillin-binding protein 2